MKHWSHFQHDPLCGTHGHIKSIDCGDETLKVWFNGCVLTSLMALQEMLASFASDKQSEESEAAGQEFP